jgi:hypothetical protein
VTLKNFYRDQMVNDGRPGESYLPVGVRQGERGEQRKKRRWIEWLDDWPLMPINSTLWPLGRFRISSAIS